MAVDVKAPQRRARKGWRDGIQPGTSEWDARHPWPHKDDQGEPWHAPTCELYEVNESDCAYKVGLCTCGFVARSEHDKVLP